MSWISNAWGMDKWRRKQERKFKEFIKKYEVKAIIVSELEKYFEGELSPKVKALLSHLFDKLKDAVDSEDIARRFIEWLKDVAQQIKD